MPNIEPAIVDLASVRDQAMDICIRAIEHSSNLSNESAEDRQTQIGTLRAELGLAKTQAELVSKLRSALILIDKLNFLTANFRGIYRGHIETLIGKLDQAAPDNVVIGVFGR